MRELLDVAIALLAGLTVGKLMNKVKIPLVAGYVLAGLVLGESFFGILDGKFLSETGFVSDMALGFIAFSIGEELKIQNIKRMGVSVLVIAFFEAFAAFLLVFLGLLSIGQPLSNALLLAAVASATAPAATVMVVKEFRAKGPLTNTLLAVVAIDDAICLAIFALASSFAKSTVFENVTVSMWQQILGPLWEIVGSLLLGALLGLVLSFVVARLKAKNELLVAEVGFVFLGIALSQYCNFSSLLTSMALGTIIANVSIKRKQAFELVGTFVPPIYTMFFVLAGARLNIGLLPKIGLVGVVFLILRFLGKLGGASLGASLSKAEPVVRKYIGFGLLSQIGVAVGLAMMVGREFRGTDLGDLVVTILLATTIITEIVGPVSTRWALIRSGEAYKN